MYSLPYDTHRWILGPLTNQRNVRYQLFARDIKLLHSIKYEILTLTLTLTLTLNKIYFDINEKDKQQEIDNMISRYQ